MKIHTLKVVEYRGAKIYIRHFRSTFEWLAIVKGTLYGSHNTITRSWWQILTGQDYTPEQLTNITKLMVNTAEATVDYVLDQQVVKKKT